jgi:hypothetical protein
VLPSALKRYQYAVAGLSPGTSTCTVWSEVALAVVLPEATTAVNASLVEISQPTETSGPTPDPGSASTEGVTRVQSTIWWGSGSPDATPCTNGADAATASGHEARAIAAALPPIPPAIRVRRLTCGIGAPRDVRDGMSRQQRSAPALVM